ncbi:unnamed protein product [Caenorhabditis angaria]|uniref:Uncharacterized protein n=1 Tax=Caenorhabditis angaria TaxID=860376 RepID=A0A9P1N5R8_9PELO|nr:unnamed protein product [Caenorhabditis angaria]
MRSAIRTRPKEGHRQCDVTGGIGCLEEAAELLGEGQSPRDDHPIQGGSPTVQRMEGIDEMDPGAESRHDSRRLSFRPHQFPQLRLQVDLILQTPRSCPASPIAPLIRPPSSSSTPP